MLKAKLLGATAAAEVVAIEDVFSTYLYTGNGSTQTITNGIDLAGEGGLVWTKRRNDTLSHQLFDTLRGVNVQLSTDVTNGNTTVTNRLNSFNADGFTLGGGASGPNVNGSTYASWTFRQAPRFFDVVTYTGTGANRTIAHDLGVVPGCIIVKRTDTTGDWQVYHRSNANTEYMVLNSTAAKATGATRWNSTTPTSTVFSLGTDASVNASGGTYVAYLFAHDPLGPSGDGSDGLIACGSYTGNGQGYVSGGNTVNVGWEPQWVMIFPATVSGYGATIFDNMRGMVEGNVPQDFFLQPLSAAGEASYSAYIAPTSTGFKLETGGGYVNESSQTYIYIAIRRGPMREPTVGTQVFAQAYRGQFGLGEPHYYSGFVTDMVLNRRSSVIDSTEVYSRMTGGPKYLVTDSTAAEGSNPNNRFDFMTGFGASGTTVVLSDLYAWMFRRAPGFFDVVAYTGNGVAGRTVSHNLGVAPEMIIVKTRSGTTSWNVLHTIGASQYDVMFLNTFSNNTSISYSTSGRLSAQPTQTSFFIGSEPQVNASGGTFIAYLFASMPGISKVGSYTGNGSSQTINCAFTTGARFVLIKRTDNSGDWYVWDTARGIVSGNDPHLSLNTTAAEVTSNDTIDPDSTGFIVNQVAATNVNVNAASYIFYAVS